MQFQYAAGFEWKTIPFDRTESLDVQNTRRTNVTWRIKVGNDSPQAASTLSSNVEFEG